MRMWNSIPDEGRGWWTGCKMVKRKVWQRVEAMDSGAVSQTCMVRMRAEASLSDVLTYPRPYSSSNSCEMSMHTNSQMKSVREPTSIDPIHKESHGGRENVWRLSTGTGGDGPGGWAGPAGASGGGGGPWGGSGGGDSGGKGGDTSQSYFFHSRPSWRKLMQGRHAIRIAAATRHFRRVVRPILRMPCPLPLCNACIVARQIKITLMGIAIRKRVRSTAPRSLRGKPSHGSSI